MNEETIKILEKQQAIILGEVEMLKKVYAGHISLISDLNIIEQSAHITIDYLDTELKNIMGGKK